MVSREAQRFITSEGNCVIEVKKINVLFALLDVHHS